MLIDKENMFPAPHTKRRSKRLITQNDDVQVQSTVLHVEDPEGEHDQLLQLKFWTKGMEAWSMVIYDRRHNIIAATGPCRHEKQGWKAVTGILKRKGYWGGELQD
jgi:hypothetical protein